MTESEYIDSIRSEVRHNYPLTSEVVKRVDEALEKFPSSPALWCLRGDVIQLSDDIDYVLEAALNSYKKAIELDPNNAETYEEIGHFYNAVNDAPATAESYFRKAVALGGGESSKRGLAGVLAELNQRRDEK